MKTRMFVVLAALLTFFFNTQSVLATHATPPETPVKLVFIHHSVGENWLADGGGNLGIALMNNNYFVSDTNYGWTAGGISIGDNTDIGHWWTWFRGPDRDTITAALYSESAQHSSYSRMTDNPGGENEIILFKSCFPNSILGGNIDDPAVSGDNPLRGEDSGSEYMTLANAKGIYNDLLEYFASRRDKLFIAITAPPVVEGAATSEEAANARMLNYFLVNEWLKDYAYKNVAVFDLFNVLSGTDNHHRWYNYSVQHIVNSTYNFSVYPSAPNDSHPNNTGNIKATAEFVELLNYYYNTWKEIPAPYSAPTVTTGPVTSVTAATVVLTGTVNPNNAGTLFYFEAGTTTDYGIITLSSEIGNGAEDVSVSYEAAGLSPETTYHYRIVAINVAGTSYGSDLTFTTPADSSQNQNTDTPETGSDSGGGGCFIRSLFK